MAASINKLIKNGWHASSALAAAVLLGFAVLVVAQAVPAFVRFESEAGQLAGCTSTVADGQASGGNALQFNECGGSDGGDSPTAGAVLPINYDLSSLTGTVRYVATNGSDSNNGSSVSSPVATLARAISLTSSANSTIVVRGGEYRNQYAIGISGAGRNGLRIIAYPGETPVFNGAVTVPSGSGWTTEGSLRYRAYTPRPISDGYGIAFGSESSTTNLNGDGVGRYPDQAWIGDTQLKQVLNKNQLADGQFFVDRTNNRLYMTAADAAKQGIEVSRPGTGAANDRDRAIQIQSSGVVIEGIRFTRYAANANDYGIILFEGTASNSQLRNVELSHTPFAASHLANNDNVTFKNVTVSHVGWIGVSATMTDALTLDSVKIADTDIYDEFTSSPGSGALKTSRTRATKVIGSEIRNNKSHGLWFDQSNINIVVAGNRMSGNTGAAVFFEISDGLLLINNYIVGTTTGQPVRLAGSSGLKLINNTLVGGTPVGIYTDSRSTPGCSQNTANCAAGSADIPSDRQGRFTPPATMDWMPRMDYMINNILAYPSGNYLCSGPPAICIMTTNTNASAPIQTIIHKADAARGIPQTYINGNVYANGSGRIVAVTSPAANYTSLSAWTTAMAGSPVSISGIDADSRSGNSWVNPNGSPTAALTAVHNQAVAVPTDTEINKYIPAGTRRYGVTFSIE